MIASLKRVGEIAVISVDNPPVNTINEAVRSSLDRVLDELARERGVRAAVLLCAGSTFFSGADITEFAGPPREAAYRALFGRLEALAIPLIAAMHGTVLGGGLEIALACHYRIALAGTRIGLPEATLGIIPGAGGTQRLPRLIGVDKTLGLIITARPIDAAAALELGILDEVLDGDLRSGAVRYAEQLLQQGAAPRRTGERRVDPATATAEVLERARAEALRLYPNCTAALTAIEAVSAAARLPLAKGLTYETQLVNERKATTECRALVHVFFAERATRKVPGLPADAEARPVRAAGVVGSGTMGGGIAICFANAGLPVVVLDATEEALTRGLETIDATYESMVNRGRLTPADKAQRLALIRGAVDYAALRDADVIIEAVFEDLALKRRIFTQLEQVAKPGALLATNTSTLDVEAIAAATRRPEDVIGLHFFSPANVMRLLEVVRTRVTSASAIRTAMELAKPLRKIPVLARVCYGFIGNRMMEGYAREALRMLLEGATPRQVDGALERFGMAMGILAVFDLAGVDVGVKIHLAHADRYPPDPTYYQADRALYEAGRCGQKNGKGFYRYEKSDRARHDDPEALRILRATAQRLNVPQRQHTDEEIVERCLYPLINEGLRILEEGVALRAADIDVVWTSGYGFPRYRGGPMFYAETIGLATVLEGMQKYAALFGPMHWEPAGLLRELVRSGSSLAEWHDRRSA